MGIDAMMFVVVPHEPTAEEVKRWSFVFGHAFHENLFLGHGEKTLAKPLMFVCDDTYEALSEDSAFIKDIGQDRLLEIPLIGRYYGVCYERGPLMTYVAMASFLERLIPGCEVLYGGDCDVAFERFDEAARLKLIDYFIKVRGHEPYAQLEDGGPDCPSCEYPMYRNGWGQEYAAYHCGGCGWQVVKSGEKTFNGFNAQRKEREGS